MQASQNGSSERDARDYAWAYFSSHVDQRMSLFNFFVALSAAAFAGLGYSLSVPSLAPLACVLGILLTFISYIFAKLDRRAGSFLKLAEDALADLETSLPTTSARLVTRERQRTEKLQRERGQLNPLYHLTYGGAFRSVFRVAAIVGIVGFVLGCFSWASAPTFIQSDTKAAPTEDICLPLGS